MTNPDLPSQVQAQIETLPCFSGEWHLTDHVRDMAMALIERLEQGDFECPGGPLTLNVDWIELKRWVEAAQ